MKLTGRNWTCAWGFAGLLIPVVLLLRWYFFDHSFRTLELVLFPSSIVLMALEGPPDRLVIAVVYAIAITANVVLYAIIGLLSWLLLSPVIRRHT
jgi:hypothetical protein